MERKTIYHFIYGRPCSGKTEALQQLVNKFNVTYISVGNITRNEIANGSILGLQLKSHLEAIKEYPASLITQTMQTHILTANTSIAVLDGYPKYGIPVENVEALEVQPAKHNKKYLETKKRRMGHKLNYV